MVTISKLDIKKGAVISKCEKYRYQLWRIWDESLPAVMFVMLNPSTADADEDDPTIRRCIGFAKSWGYGGIYVGNLFAYRATNPKELLYQEEAEGGFNWPHLLTMEVKCDKIICAWGNYGIVKKLTYKKYKPVLRSKSHCLGISKDGAPKHPLYLKGDLKPIPFNI